MTAFLLTSIIFFCVWLILFLFSNETRREQIIMSIVGLVLAPGILLIAAYDFRQIVSDNVAVVGIEDVLFTFSFFGIAAVIYQVLIGRHAHKLRGSRYEVKHLGHWVGHLLLILGLWAFCALLLIEVFSLSSIQGLIVGGLLVGMYVIADRHDLTMNALLSGLFMAALVFIIEQIFFVRLFPIDAASFWQFDALSGFIIGGIPLEELMWAAVVGFTIGPLYEYLKQYQVK
ncbi:hypothetical protein EPN81_04230 [Patescibacteria group bacterium]|nr:MAG: hypothetical protein EPN81_04230 [Patescibacteria group bacterium]